LRLPHRFVRPRLFFPEPPPFPGFSERAPFWRMRGRGPPAELFNLGIFRCPASPSLQRSFDTLLHFRPNAFAHKPMLLSLGFPRKGHCDFPLHPRCFTSQIFVNCCTKSRLFSPSSTFACLGFLDSFRVPPVLRHLFFPSFRWADERGKRPSTRGFPLPPRKFSLGVCKVQANFSFCAPTLPSSLPHVHLFFECAPLAPLPPFSQRNPCALTIRLPKNRC